MSSEFFRPVTILVLTPLCIGPFALLSQCIVSPRLASILRRPLPLISTLVAAAAAILGLAKSSDLLLLTIVSLFAATGTFLFFVLDRCTDEQFQWWANWATLLGIASLIIVVQTSGGTAQFLQGLQRDVDTLTASQGDISRLCFAGALGALLITFAVIETPLIAKCIILSRHWPMREHLRWNVLPNLHVWILACIACTIVALPTPQNVQPRIHAFYEALLLTWCLFWLPVALTPPQILFLHSFDERNYRARRILTAILPGHVVSLFPGATTGAGWVMCALRSIVGQGCRIASSHFWQPMVRVFMKRAEVIVMDLSFSRAGLLTELRFLASDEELTDKTMFVSQNEMEARRTLSDLVKVCSAANGQRLLSRPCFGIDDIWQPDPISFVLPSRMGLTGARLDVNVTHGMYPASRFLLYLAIAGVLMVLV